MIMLWFVIKYWILKMEVNLMTKYTWRKSRQIQLIFTEH